MPAFTGLAIIAGGGLRDAIANVLAASSPHPATAYSVVYLLEFLLLFITLAAIGPLVRMTQGARAPSPSTTFNAFSARPAGM